MQPLLWILIMVILVVAEAMTYGLFTIWFVPGALAAAVLSYYKYGTITQLLVFFILSLALLVITRPLAVRYMKKGMPRTNVNSMIGRSAIVSEPVDNLAQTGKVLIGDVEWIARTAEDGMHINKGIEVQVSEVQGVHLIVEPKLRMTGEVGDAPVMG
ncbi:MAG: NfeD family protein [Blautia sp.]|nr:NfeD family protein [Blautia sp.]